MESNLDNVEETFYLFFKSLENLLNFCEEKSHYANSGDIEFCQEQLRNTVNTIEWIKITVENSSSASVSLLNRINNLMECFCLLKSVWDQLTSSVPRTCPSYPNVIEGAGLVFASSEPGRPLSFINTQQVVYLFHCGFKLKEIAKMFSVHRTTLWRRLQSESFHLFKYSEIDDTELETVMKNIYQNHPHTGMSMMMGHLHSVGLFVQRKRVRNILRAIDPTNSVQRWGLVTYRRTYSVPGPNSLWHIDGHHALVRWKLFTHGAIDGFSRLILYLKCSNNNLSHTVLNLFLEAVEKYSLPSRVRDDRGSENFGIANFMEMRRGVDRGSFIFGSSVHNSRIEMLWRDVFYSVIQKYYSLFYYLEDMDLLDVENEKDIFCLHYVFLPRINTCLVEFTQAYNNHGVRTEHSWSPLRMWINRMINIDGQNSKAVTTLFHNTSQNTDENIAEYTEYRENMFQSNDNTTMEVQEEPEVTNDTMDRLMSINPLAHSDQHGVDLYDLARHIVS